MNKKMRVANRAIEKEEITEVLESAEYGVLSTISTDNTAYGVPLNFAYKDGAIYFHCALEGHKLENIRSNNSGCFTIVDSVKLLPSSFSTEYRSVIVSGTVHLVTDEQEKRKGLISIVEKLSPDFLEKGIAYVDKAFDRAQVMRMDIENMTGKAKKPAQK